MARARIYLDHNATSPLLPAARAAMAAAMDATGNPSSIHAEGRAARATIEAARVDVAALFGVAAARVIFTSGGTEAAHRALAGIPAAATLFIGGGEHACVREGHSRHPDEVEPVALTRDGVIDLDDLARRISARVQPVVALQAANNETGVVQPVAAAAAIVHAHGGWLICDAVQAAGRIDCAMAALNADIAFMSAHKIGGPHGVGALVLAPGIELSPGRQRGGGQEQGRRPGTENVAAIAGFGAAAKAARQSAGEPTLRDRFEQGLRAFAPDAVIFGADAPRLPNTSAFAIPGLSAGTLLMALDLEGFAISSGAACSSGKIAPSHVLAAMGVEPSLAAGALRMSLGVATEVADIDAFLAALAMIVGHLKSRSLRNAA